MFTLIAASGKMQLQKKSSRKSELWNLNLESGGMVLNSFERFRGYVVFFSRSLKCLPGDLACNIIFADDYLLNYWQPPYLWQIFNLHNNHLFIIFHILINFLVFWFFSFFLPLSFFLFFFFFFFFYWSLSKPNTDITNGRYS